VFFLLLPSLVLIVYAVVSGVLPLKISRGAKIILSLLITAVGLKYQVYISGNGTYFDPLVPRPLMIVYEALYGALIYFVVLLFIKDCAGVLMRLIRSGSGVRRLLNTGVCILVLAIFSLLCGIAGTYEALRVPNVTKITITVPKLPDAWKGCRIVQLSDLHLGAVQGAEWLSKVVAKVNAEKPDFVVVTGDFVDGSTDKLLKELSPLKDIRAPQGVFGIPGNHEYYSGYEAWMKALKKMGITMLENESAVLKKNGEPLVLGGTTDFGAYKFGLTNPDLKKTFAGTPVSPRILLTHQPKTTSKSTTPFDLQLSGHTHGGHLFFLQPVVGYFNDWLVSGLYQRGSRQIYVNNGTGLWNGFSQRFFVPSEISVITLE
jgi:hypothetical protein